MVDSNRNFYNVNGEIPIPEDLYSVTSNLIPCVLEYIDNLNEVDPSLDRSFKFKPSKLEEILKKGRENMTNSDLFRMRSFLQNLELFFNKYSNNGEIKLKELLIKGIKPTNENPNAVYISAIFSNIKEPFEYEF
jgi:hypothetical protein